MKTKKFLCFILSLGLIIGISCFLFFNTQKLDQNFVRVPVHFFPLNNVPTMDVKIEEKTYPLIIDSGSFQYFSLEPNCLKQIKNKESASTCTSIGIKGNAYDMNLFQIPKIMIANNLRIACPVSERPPQKTRDDKLCPNPTLWNQLMDKLRSIAIDGIIGLGVFKEFDCFFDFPNSQLILAKNMKTLTDEAGCSFQDFIKVPFSLEDYGVVLTFETDIGAKRFILDSGATLSVFRESLVGKESAKEIEPGKWFYKANKLSIGNHDFGNWSFYLYNFAERFDVDGILGIDFFTKHSICLDFPNRTAYIKAHQSLPDKFVSWINSNQM